MSKLVKVSLSYDQLECLMLLYRRWLQLHIVTSEWEDLLHDHNEVLYQSLYMKLLANNNKYTLNLAQPEARAFMHTWQLFPVEVNPYEMVMLQNIIAKIDRTAKEPKRLRQPR